MTEPAPDYLRELYILDNFVDKDLSIPLVPAEGRRFRHLILTGRNGCGKTRTLAGLFRSHDRNSSWHVVRREGGVFQVVKQAFGASWLAPCSQGSFDARAWQPDGVTVRILRFFEARRRPSFEAPKGPTGEVRLQGANQIEQVLINWQTQVALATTAGDAADAARFQGRLDRFREQLQSLLRPLDLTMEFTRADLRFRLRHPGGLVDLEQLPDGVQAALHLWLETWTAVEQLQAAEGPDAGGVVLIDEPESHLHLGLQEKLLPFLAGSFPTVQLVVATHSPAIAASLEDALIYDLTAKRGWKSEDFHAWRYGRVMTEVFGLDDEYSVSVTAELQRLEALRDKPDRSPAEEAELRALAARLRGSTHAMVLDVSVAGTPRSAGAACPS